MTHTEHEVSIPSEFSLSGTLRIPNGQQHQLPAILIIAGSGRGDRDGNLKKLNTNIYKLLAEELTRQGLITLRYDKRGVGKSKGNYYEAGLSDFITDASNALRFLKTQPHVDPNKIIILGHSEGALIAPAVYTKEKANGLILLCGAATPGIELMPQQSTALAREINALSGLKGVLLRLANVEKQFNKTLNKTLVSDKPMLRIFGKKFNAKWLRETYQHDVCAYLSQLDCPTLFINGGKDIQMPPSEADKVGIFVKGPLESTIIPTMNHLLRDYQGTHHMLSLMKEYRQSVQQDLSPELIRAIQTWIQQFLASPNLTQTPQTGIISGLEMNCNSESNIG